MTQMKHWQDPVNALLGAWLVLSPWAANFADNQVAMVNFVVVGLLLIATRSAPSRSSPAPWPFLSPGNGRE